MEATGSMAIQLMHFLAVKSNVFIYLIMQQIKSSLINEKFGNLCVTLALLSLGRSKHWHLLVDKRNYVLSPWRSLLIYQTSFFQFRRWYKSGRAHAGDVWEVEKLFPELVWKFRSQTQWVYTLNTSPVAFLSFKKKISIYSCFFVTDLT